MNNGTLSLNFWLALAGAVVAFGVALVVGHAGLLISVIIAAIVFALLMLILGIAFSGKSEAAAPLAAPPSAAPEAKATPAAKAEAAPVATDETAAPVAKADAAPAAIAETAAPVAAAETPAAPAAKAADKPDQAPVPGSVGQAPPTLTAPRDGRADDLKVIEGIGPALEKLVNSLGFFHYDQIANWTADEVAWVDSHMKNFRGRIARDKWQAQAKIILAEGIPAFLERAKTNNY